MSAKVEIKDGTGSSALAQVAASSNALLTQRLPETAKGLEPSLIANLRELSAFFVDTTGSAAQNVDGSVTPVEFSISASPEKTKWVVGFRLIIEGASLTFASNDFRRYGAAATAPGLTNGVLIQTEQQGAVVNISAEPINILGDYLDYAQGFTNFTNAISAGVDYVNLDFQLSRPVVLPPGSIDAVKIIIQDDLTAIDKQVAVARGYQEDTE